MKIIEMKVPLEKAEKIFYIIEKVLEENINTQIQIDNCIVEELRKNKAKHGIHLSKMCTTRHYNPEDEKWFVYNEENSFSHAIARASFIGNSLNYQQLVQYKSEKILNYKHFMVNFEQLLLINKE